MASCRRSRILAAGCAVLVCAANARAQNPDIEHGLYVWQSRDTLHVQWLTDIPSSGTVQVITPKKELVGETTAGSTAHHVKFAKFREDDFVLRFDGGDVAIREPVPERSVTLPHADSLYVFGDTHGEYDSVVLLLRNAGLIDENLKWTGGRKHIVFLGDVVDRGRRVTQLLWFIYRLEQEAKQAGGAVHMLLGNHEVMVMLGDLRYVHPDEDRIAKLHKVSYQRLLHPQQSVIGRWLASRPAVMKIGDLLLTHGGVSSDFIGQTPESLAKTLNENIRDGIFVAHVDTTRKVRVDSAHYARWDNFFWGNRSLFWYRGYAESDTLSNELTKTLASFDAGVMVVGHTPAHTMQTRYRGKLIIAHPRRPGSELMLITGQGTDRKLHRIVAHGPAEPISP